MQAEKKHALGQKLRHRSAFVRKANVPFFPFFFVKQTAWQHLKPKENHIIVSSPWKGSAGTRRLSIFASPPVTSFVRQGHHWRPCPPAEE